MPSILRLRLLTQTDTSLHLERAPAHGWFHALIAACDPAWSAELHPSGNTPAASSDVEKSASESLPPPFTLSPIYRPTETLGEDDMCLGRLLFRPELGPDGRDAVHIRAGQPLAMRLALADDDRAQWLCRILASTELPGIGQNRAICRLARLPRLEPGDPDSMFASWAVLAAAPPAERLLVHFQTPTAFSRRGESLLLPELERMLESWRRAWRRAPLLPEGIEHIPVETLRITRYVLRTETLSLKGGLRIGFIGEMELTLRTGTTPQVCCAVTALASVADFFGTGAKTALGMGQTRVRIADVRAVPTHESPAVRNAPSSL